MSSAKTPEIISKYFFKPNGEIEIPPPGAIINGVEIMGLRRATLCTPMNAAAMALQRQKQRKHELKSRREEYFSKPHPVHTTSPLPSTPTQPIVVDDDDDDDDEVEMVVPPRTQKPLFEFEELDDEDSPMSDDDDEKPVDDPKQYVFIENKDEYKFVCSRTDRRPNEEYIVKKTWTMTDINDFLGVKLGFTRSEIDKIIALSKEIIRYVARLDADYNLLQKGVVERKVFTWDNAFDFHSLAEEIEELYKVEKRPRQHVVMILVPGSKPKFIASDLPCWMTADQKRTAAHLLFCPPEQPIKRVLYWVNPTTGIKEPFRVFGDQRPCDVSSIEPPIERKDHITTAFMSRYWKLERLFSVPEFF